MSTPRQETRLQKAIESIIYQSRWVLLPFYFGLIVAQVLYCYKFVQNVWELCHTFSNLDETAMMLLVLSLIDIAMIANLIKMIISGSYQTFISPIEQDDTEKVGSGLLKVKMGSSLVGVSSIHLLQSFINSTGQTNREIFIKCAIHMVFLVSTVGLAWMDYLHYKTKGQSH